MFSLITLVRPVELHAHEIMVQALIQQDRAPFIFSACNSAGDHMASYIADFSPVAVDRDAFGANVKLCESIADRLGRNSEAVCYLPVLENDSPNFQGLKIFYSSLAARISQFSVSRRGEKINFCESLRCMHGPALTRAKILSRTLNPFKPGRSQWEQKSIEAMFDAILPLSPVYII